MPPMPANRRSRRRCAAACRLSCSVRKSPQIPFTQSIRWCKTDLHSVGCCPEIARYEVNDLRLQHTYECVCIQDGETDELDHKELAVEGGIAWSALQQLPNGLE
jgi:hypothetical protein